MWRKVNLASVLAISLFGNGLLLAQDTGGIKLEGSVNLPPVRSILEEPQEYVISIDNPTEIPPARVPADVSSGEPIPVDGELVQQLYPNGMPRVTKYVALNLDGNYVNHGEYQEWSESGKLIVNGRFAMGLQQGVWTKTCEPKDSRLFESDPYKKFKAPFQSTAEFKNGKLNGTWTITDKDGKKVSEVQLVDGKRNGPANWYFPTGTILWHGDYKDGLLHGSFIEKDATGKVARQAEYLNGQKSEKKTEYHNNKKARQEYQILASAQTLATLDDWHESTLATYENKGEEVKHGSSITYYESGLIRTQTNFKNGIQDGEFVSWYPNNQRESTGSYSDGRQHGKWSWWHENGMRKTVASYEHGAIVGSVLAWNDQGVRVTANELAATKAQPAPKPQQTGNRSSSKSANSSRRPGNK